MLQKAFGLLLSSRLLSKVARNSARAFGLRPWLVQALIKTHSTPPWAFLLMSRWNAITRLNCLWDGASDEETWKVEHIWLNSFFQVRTLAKKAFEKQTKLVTGKHKVRPFAAISLGKAKGKYQKSNGFEKRRYFRNFQSLLSAWNWFLPLLKVIEMLQRPYWCKSH